MTDDVVQSPEKTKPKGTSPSKNTPKPRGWNDVASLVHKGFRIGKTDRELALEMQIPTDLIKQMRLRSYGMSAQTIRHFNRCEEARIASLKKVD